MPTDAASCDATFWADAGRFPVAAAATVPVATTADAVAMAAFAESMLSSLLSEPTPSAIVPPCPRAAPLWRQQGQSLRLSPALQLPRKNS